MTELQLYKFVHDNNVEHHAYKNQHLNEPDVIIMPSVELLSEFTKLLSNCIFDDDGIALILKQGYVCIWMHEICDYYGIEMNNVFPDYKTKAI